MMKVYFLVHTFWALYSFFRALKIDITPRKGASLLNFLVFKQALFNIMLISMLSHALSMLYLCFIYALSMLYLYTIYAWAMGFYDKNMNYQGGQEGRFSEKSEKCADFGKYGN